MLRGTRGGNQFFFFFLFFLLLLLSFVPGVSFPCLLFFIFLFFILYFDCPAAPPARVARGEVLVPMHCIGCLHWSLAGLAGLAHVYSPLDACIGAWRA